MARWNSEKNELLKETRHVSFEQVEEIMRKKEVLDDYEHPNQGSIQGRKLWLLGLKATVMLFLTSLNLMETFGLRLLCRAESRRENMEVSNVVF